MENRTIDVWDVRRGAVRRKVIGPLGRWRWRRGGWFGRLVVGQDALNL
jgi:hypothetical protein